MRRNRCPPKERATSTTAVNKDGLVEASPFRVFRNGEGRRFSHDSAGESFAFVVSYAETGAFVFAAAAANRACMSRVRCGTMPITRSMSMSWPR